MFEFGVFSLCMFGFMYVWVYLCLSLVCLV